MKPSEIDAFLDGPDDDINSFLDTPADTGDPIKSLGTAVMEALKSSLGAASPFQKGPVLETVQEQGPQFAKGGVTGLRREEVPPDAGIAEQAGQLVGRYGLPVGVPLAVGMATGGLSLPAQAAAAGLSAAAGEAEGMAAAKALGGNAPESIEDAAMGVGKSGLSGALTALGFGGAVKAVSTVAPRFLQSTQIIPSESLARQIDTGAKALRKGNLTQAGAELRASVALRKIQEAASVQRTALGKEVDTALEAFHAKAGGKAVVNVGEAAQRGLGVLDDAVAGGTNEAIQEAAKASDAEIKLIRGIAEKMQKAPQMTPKEVVALRRMIDDLTEFRKGGAPPVSSAAGQRAAHELGAGLRDAIEESAKINGAPQLLKANRAASQFYRQYDDISREIFTRKIDSGSMKDAVVRLMNRYNAGGVDKGRIENLGKILPRAARDVDDLLNYGTAREVLIGVKKTPSGIGMSALRSILPALGLIRGLPAAKQAEAITRILTRAGAAGAASKTND